MPTTAELIAYNRTEREVAKEIKAEYVLYQTLPDLKRACQDAAICRWWWRWWCWWWRRETEYSPLDGPSPSDFECSCFDGNYVGSWLIIIMNDLFWDMLLMVIDYWRSDRRVLAITCWLQNGHEEEEFSLICWKLFFYDAYLFNTQWIWNSLEKVIFSLCQLLTDPLGHQLLDVALEMDPFQPEAI